MTTIDIPEALDTHIILDSRIYSVLVLVFSWEKCNTTRLSSSSKTSFRESSLSLSVFSEKDVSYSKKRHE